MTWFLTNKRWHAHVIHKQFLSHVFLNLRWRFACNELHVCHQICWRQHVSHLHVSHCFQEQTGRLPRAGEMIVDQGCCYFANRSLLQNWSQNFAEVRLGIRTKFGIPQSHGWAGNHWKPMDILGYTEIYWDNGNTEIILRYLQYLAICVHRSRVTGPMFLMGL